MLKQKPAAKADEPARSRHDDLGNLPHRLGTGDSPENAAALDDLRDAIRRYRDERAAPDVRTKQVTATAAEISVRSAELAALVLRLTEQAKGLTVPGYFVPSHGDVSADFLASAPEIAGTLRLLARVADGVAGEVHLALGHIRDEGGQGGVRSRLIGSAKYRFVLDLLDVWERFRGPAPARAEGPFHDFVVAANAVAGGDLCESFEWHTRRLPTAARRRREEWNRKYAEANMLLIKAKHAPPDEAEALHEQAMQLSDEIFSPDFWTPN